MPGHTYTITWTNGASTVTKSTAVTADEQVELSATIPGSSANLQHTMHLDVSAMSSAFLLCTAAATVKTNSSSAPDATITLTANVPVCWYTGGGGTNPFGAVDVTTIYVTCADGGTLYIGALQDPTP